MPLAAMDRMKINRMQCVFPWISAVIGLLSYGVFRFSKWFDGNGGGRVFLIFCNISDPDRYLLQEEFIWTDFWIHRMR